MEGSERFGSITVYYYILPLATTISEDWATCHDFPFAQDRSDLARVSQFLAIKRSEIFPKQEMKKLFSSRNPPDFSEPDEPHGILADLNLPIYDQLRQFYVAGS